MRACDSEPALRLLGIVVKGRGNGGANDISESGSSGESIYFTGFRRIYEIINIGSHAHFVQRVL